MRRFTSLLADLERCSEFSERVMVLRNYLSLVSPAEACWAISILLNRDSKALVRTNKLRELVKSVAHISDWLLDECLNSVGDLAETLSLVLPRASKVSSLTLTELMEKEFAEIKTRALATNGEPGPALDDLIMSAWDNFDEGQKLLLNKMLIGTLRYNASADLIVQTLAQIYRLQPFVIAARLATDWKPSQEFFNALVSPDLGDVAEVRPYDFADITSISYSDLGSSDQSAISTSEISGCLAEWKWRGIRVQLVKRNGKISIWSENQTLLSNSFPDLTDECSGITDGVVLEGQIIPFKDADILPKQTLMQRLSKKSVSKKVMDETPVVFMAYDILEFEYNDIRHLSIEERRDKLQFVLTNRSQIKSQAEFEQLTLFAPCQLQLSTKLRTSPVLQVESGVDLHRVFADVRLMKVGGLILKKKGSSYGSENWIAINPDPIVINAVLVAAQPARGKRRGPFTDFTLALWKETELVSIVRTSANLPDDDLYKVDKFVRENTIAKFGPVSSVDAKLVLEVSCKGVYKSSRHKSGIVLSAPQIMRLRSNISQFKADQLKDLLRYCE